MKISTKARYGLRSLVDLAVHGTGEAIPLVYIAKRQQLSVNYLEQVFSLLKKGNIVKSVKGAQGGYVLARSASNITVGEILRAIEGEICIVEQDENENDSLISQTMQRCLQEQVWDKITASVNEAVDHMTLEDLAKQYQETNQSGVYMYYI